MRTSTLPKYRIVRHRINRWIVLILGMVTILGLGVARTSLAQGTGDVGYRDFYWYASGVSHPTGEKPQSKLWFNDGLWWGSLFNRSSGEYHIYRFNWTTQSWSDTGTLIDERNNSHADTLWDGTHLYVATAGPSNSASGDSARILRFGYDAATKRYILDSGFPVTISSAGMEAIVLDKDTTGKLWVTYTQGSKVYVNRSTGNDLSWGTPFIPPVKGTSVSADDISAVIAFESKIGVMWSNQIDDAMYFAVHLDSDPDNVWQASRTAIQGPKNADDHLNLKQLAADASGRVFAIVKTSLNDLPNPNPHAPLIFLLVLGQDDNWTNYVFGRVGDDHTRPIVLIDEEHRMLYVFAATPIGGGTINSGKALTAIYYKQTSLDNISFPDGKGLPFIQSSTYTGLYDPTSTKQNLNSTTGLLVAAADTRAGYYFHNVIDLGSGTLTPTPTNTPIPVPTDTPTPTNTPIPVPTDTPTPTNTPIPVPTDTPTPTNTPIPVPTDTPTPTPVGTSAVSSYQSAVLADNPVSYWRLGELSGTTAADSVDGNPGTIMGGVTLGATGALVGDSDTAMTFNGSYAYIRVANNANLNVTGDFTLEAWAKLASLDGVSRAVVHKGGTSGYSTWQYRLSVTSGNVWRGTVYIGGSSYNVTDSGTPTLNGWDYLVLTRSGSTLTLYVNGVSVATGTANGALNSGTGILAIGRTGSSSSHYFNGSIDEVAIYDTALSASRILAHYNAAINVIDLGSGTLTPTSTPIPVPTDTPTPTNTPISVPTDTPTPTSTPIPVPTDTPTPTSTPIPVPTDTPTPTSTPIPVLTDTPTPTSTPIPVLTDTPTPTSTPIPVPTDTPTPTSTPIPVPTDTPTPTSTPIPVPTDTPTPTPVGTSAVSSYQSAVLADNPVSYWRLGELSGTTAADSVDGNPGTIKGGVTLGAAGALVGDSDTAMTFNGSYAYINITDNANLNITGDFTLEAWAKLASLDGVSRAVVHKGGTSGYSTWQYRLSVTSGNVWRGTVYIGGKSFDVTDSGTPTLNGWDYLVLTRSGSTPTLYVNGVSVATGTANGALNSGTGILAIGRTGSSSSHYFNGSIDEVAIYGAALSASRILAHYNAAISP